MNLKVTSVNAIVSTLAVVVPHSVASNASVSAKTQAVQNERILEKALSSRCALPTPTAMVSENQHWNAEKNLRFKQLARQEALGPLTLNELAELESLTRLRHYDKNPRTADEILWQRRQEKVTQNLIAALKEYVEFHTPSSNS